jgi:hypothetical protein
VFVPGILALLWLDREILDYSGRAFTGQKYGLWNVIPEAIFLVVSYPSMNNL